MEEFLEMKNYLFRLYEDAVSKYPLSESEDNFYNLNYDEEEVENNLDYYNRLSYMHDRIIEDSDVFENFISLFTIYFYSGSKVLKSFNDEIEEYITMILEEEDLLESDDSEIIENAGLEDDVNNEENKIFESIELESKEDFIFEIKNQDTDYLMQMLEMFYEKELYYLDNKLIKEGIEEDKFCNWEIMEATLSDENIKNIFIKFHPNLKKEYLNYKEYLQREDALKILSNLKIKNTKDFLELFYFARNKFEDDDYLTSFLLDFLDNLKEDNKALYINIVLLLIRNYYIIKSSGEENNVEFLSEEVGFLVKKLKYLEQYNLDDCIVESFISFDFNKIREKYEKLNDYQKKVFEEYINIDVLRNYGTSGYWVKITEEEQLNKYKYFLNKYGYYLNNRLDNKKDSVGYLYLSKDKNGLNTIPRLYIVVEDNCNVKEVLGNDYSSSIEFDMLDILESKVKEINVKDKFLEEISYMRKLGNINNKIDKQINLSREEIDMLYGISGNYNVPFEDTRLCIIKGKANTKKNLATYYGCLENEVANSIDELNENTVVYARSLVIGYVSTCNYPKLKVVFGDLFASCLMNAEGLKSLQVVKGNLWFESLENSKGLENLIYVGESANFECLEDSSFLNSNLYVEKDLIIKGNKVKQPPVKKKGIRGLGV